MYLDIDFLLSLVKVQERTPSPSPLGGEGWDEGEV